MFNFSPLKRRRLMPFLELFDETLDINSAENYELALQVSPDGLAYCLLDTIRNKFILLRVYEPEENKYLNAEKIGEILKKDDFLNRRFKKVKIIVPSPKFTLIPAPLFDPAKKDEYFKFNHIREDNNVIITNRLSDPDSYLVYSISKQTSELLSSHFPGVFPLHNAVPLFFQLSHNRKSAQENYIHVHVEKTFFYLIIFNQKTLKFCNTFNYRNISDILYFVLNVFKKLEIKQEETIHFSGQTEKYDDLSSNFSIYVRNIKFTSPYGNFTFSYVFDDTELHRFLNLFSVINCE